MCGIVAYTGRRSATPILLQGLERLEYRGYDSAGLATLAQPGQNGSANVERFAPRNGNGNGRHKYPAAPTQLYVRKSVGKLAELARLLRKEPAAGACGISHTRWATHGGVTFHNAHPHVGGQAAVALVHNGVIENYAALKKELVNKGVRFQSDTDSEVLAQLIAGELDGDLVQATCRALERVKGTYGIAVISPYFPGLIVAASLGSPVVIGLGDNENFVASDPGALAGYTERVIYLHDRQICSLSPNQWQVMGAAHAKTKDSNGAAAARDWIEIAPKVHHLKQDPLDADKGEFEHFMLKEIFEQADAIERAMSGRLDEADCTASFSGLELDPQQLGRVERIILTGCGTSYHAGLVGEYLIESLARIPVEVEYASEFRYRNPPLDRRTLVIALSQSGETADTLAALRESKRKGLPTLALCNVPGSAMDREADATLYLHAGPEIGVASTKAFSAQVTLLMLWALYLGRMRHLSSVAGGRIIEQLHQMPALVRETLHCHDDVSRIADRYYEVSNCLYLGRQYLYPVALEGALKLKEISYVHAEGYPAAEMKHGPIALVDEHTPSIFLAARCPVYDKVMSNMEEIRARGGPVIAVACRDDAQIAEHADELIFVPQVAEHWQPLVAVVPLQLFAYHVARLRGCDIDKPRNLAKSVTVE